MLVGRSHDLEALREALSAPSGMAVVSGPAGIGKTSLLQRLAAEHQGRVGSAVGVPGGRQIPLRDVALLHRSDAEAVAEIRATINRLLTNTPQSIESRNLLLAGLGYTLAERWSAESLLLLDDAQWYGEDSALVLSAMVATSAVPTLIAVRSGDPADHADHADQALAALLSAREQPRHVALAGLTRVEVDHLLTELGHPGDPTAHDRTGGVPLLVEWLASTGGGAGTTGQGVDAAARRLLAGLDADERALLQAIACCEGDQTQAMLGTVSGLEASRLDQVVGRLRANGLLSASAPVACHPALGEAVLAGTSADERARLRREVARFLHLAQSARATHASAARIARHLGEAGPLGEPWAARVWLEAAREHLATHSLDLARLACERGLAEGTGEERAALLESSVYVEIAADDLSAAENRLRELEGCTDSGRAGAARSRLTAAALTRVDAELLARLQPGESPAAGRASGTTRSVPSRTDLALATYGMLGSAWRRDAHATLVDRLRSAGELLDEPVVGQAIAGLGSWVAISSGDPQLAQALLMRARRDGAAPDALLAPALGVATITCWMLDRPQEAQWFFDDGRRMARALGPATGLERSLDIFEAIFALRDGHLHRGAALLEGLDSTQPLVPTMAPLEAAAQLRLAMLRADDVAVTQRVEVVQSVIAGQEPPGPGVPHAVATLIEAALRPGSGGSAPRPKEDPRLDHLLDLAEVVVRCGGRFAPLTTLRLRLDCSRGRLDNAGLAAGARECAAAAFGDVERAEHLSVVAAVEPDPEQSLKAAHEAAGLLDADRYPEPALNAQLALGAALHRARRNSDAREVARRTATEADAHGLTVLAQQAEDLLRLSGGRSRTRHTPYGLTPAEQRVMNALGHERSTAAIAQELVLSRRTVEAHLRSIFAKLEARDRAEAAAKWAESLRDRPA